VAETLKKGSRVTGDARSQLATDLKTKYEAGESIRPSPSPPGVRTGSCTGCSANPV